MEQNTQKTEVKMRREIEETYSIKKYLWGLIKFHVLKARMCISDDLIIYSYLTPHKIIIILTEQDRKIEIDLSKGDLEQFIT